MVLPLRDIIAIQQHRGSRLGWSGLVLTIKGHEELFFEFSSVDLGQRVRRFVSGRLEEVHRSIAEGESRPESEQLREAQRLRKLEPSASQSSDLRLSLPDDAPPVMFRSTSSSFLDFRPPESLHITCLTIGSRGDVQPYIALCKGLLAEGHRVRIATHAEYREWIDGHGIEFGCVGGDPAELMRICVENGMFTVAFLREGVTKVRAPCLVLSCARMKTAHSFAAGSTTCSRLRGRPVRVPTCSSRARAPWAGYTLPRRCRFPTVRRRSRRLWLIHEPDSHRPRLYDALDKARDALRESAQ
jgi:hypothetical protein